jgi:putative membrane-bound dehydrogenase-like protein
MNRLLGVVLFALCCAVLPPLHAQVAPDKAESTFKVVDGLEMKLWASEPLFVNPTCIDIDHKGRVWVCESVNYRNKLRGFKKLTRPEGDRIVILEDTKGTGKADKSTTFYQSPELLAPLGIAVAKDPAGPGYKVFVCQSPDILVFEDKKGVGKADGPPNKLLSGFGGFDHDHGVHGILIGPDMKLYFSVGDTGVHGLQSSDKKGRVWRSNSTDCRAGTIWRCDLDGKNLELIAHNFRNEYEPCVDSFGTVFVSDNDDDGNQQTRICYVMPGGNYGYHPRGRGESHWHEEQPGVVPKILRTYFGSPTGMCVYEGKLLPKKYWGQLLHTDAGPRHVRCYHLKPQGAGYDVEREDMVTSSDNWFRPSDVCVAPDGSVFIADWYDPGVGGHGMGDITRGRIYRLAPKGNKPSVPKVDLTDKSGILEALGSPNRAVRYMAMAKLDSMDREDALKVVEAGLKLLQREIGDNKTADPVLIARQLRRLALLGTFGEIPVTALAIAGAADSKDTRLRCMAIRLMSDRGQIVEYLTDRDFKEIAQKLLHDPSAAVRWEILLALRNTDPAKAKPLIYDLMKQYDGKDRFYLAAIGIAVGRHDQKRREIILADFDKQFPEWNDKVANLVWELRPPKLLPLLEKRLSDAKIPEEGRAKIVDILAGSQDKDAGAAILKLLRSDAPAAVRNRAIENLKLFLPGKWQNLKSSPDFDKVIDSLLGKADTRLTGLSLITVAGKTEQTDPVLRIARNREEKEAVRRAAIETLGQLPSDKAIAGLVDLMSSAPGALQSDAAKALGEHGRRVGEAGRKKAVAALQEVVGNGKASQVLREAAVTGLSGSRPGTIWLLEQHAKGKLPEELVAVAGRLLRNSPYRDLQNKALVAFPPAGKLNLKKLPAIAVLAARKGDPGKGRRLIADSVKSNLQCLKCHSIRGVGGRIGPDLSMIGKKASRENLFESILYPSKAIADQYLTWQIDTVRGQSLSGLIVEETPTFVVLRDGEGRDTRILKKDIESRTKGTKSLMPEDLVVQLSEDELIDVVEYLFTLRTAALGIDSWHIAGPFDNLSGMEGLDKVYPPEKSIDLKSVYQGKDGKVRWRTVKPAAGGYVDLKAFFGDRSANIVSYLVSDIESPADQDATILLGSDDGAKLWVNDKLVHTARVTRAALPEQDTVKVKLKKGANRILLKINNGDGPHGFYLTVLSEQELKPANQVR